MRSAAQECVQRLLESEAGAALTKTYVAQHSALQAFMSASHAEWCTNLSRDLADSLKQPLLSQAGPIPNSQGIRRTRTALGPEVNEFLLAPLSS